MIIANWRLQSSRSFPEANMFGSLVLEAYYSVLLCSALTLLSSRLEVATCSVTGDSSSFVRSKCVNILTRDEPELWNNETSSSVSGNSHTCMLTSVWVSTTQRLI